MSGTAFIGLGHMGLAMARNILGAGIALQGYDLSETARNAFSEAGGAACHSAREAAQDCDLLILMVVNAAQAHHAVFDDGAAQSMTKGGTVMLCSTIAPKDAQSLAEKLLEHGLILLDAPVSGGTVGAKAGTLTIMASGPDAAFERAEPALKAISKTVHRVGSAAGLGSTYKTVHQLAAGVHLVAAAEVISLGKKAGCDPDTLLEILSSSAGQSWMLDDRGPRMIGRDPSHTSSIEIFLKDVGLVLQTGRDCAMPLPLTAQAYQMLLSAKALGFEQDDDSAVIKAYESLANIKIKS